jgi:protein arginine kinase activator
MICESCREQDAVVHLTQITGDQVTTLHLCGKCAAERGIATDAEIVQTPLGSFLAAMDQSGSAVATATAPPETCPACGATLQDFRASGRVGCSTCWSTFDAPLRDLLRRLHGATRHTGEQYDMASMPRDPESERAHERNRLRDQLRSAVASEHFELAAELRDRLRGLDDEP